MLTHTLKGMAANLGAKALASAADSMTRTARAGDSEGSLALLVGVRRHLTAVLRDIEELVPRLSQAAPAPVQKEAQPLDNSGLTSYLKALEGLLQSNSMAAADAFSDIQPVLDLLCDRRLVADLNRFIQRLDYAGALKTLKQIVKGCEMAQGGGSALP
jgi:HPt (histidine-containing phosphotransfer) domain-containing protein